MQAPDPAPTGADTLTMRLLRRLGMIELVVAAAAFLVTCGLVSWNAFLRYALNSSIVWTEEIAILATNTFVYLGAAVIYKARADISVQYFVERRSPRFQIVLRALVHILSVAFFATMLVQAIGLYPLQRDTSTFILDISRFWFTVPLIWAAASMLVTALVLTFAALRGLAGKPSTPLRFIDLPAEPQ